MKGAPGFGCRSLFRSRVAAWFWPGTVSMTMTRTCAADGAG